MNKALKSIGWLLLAVVLVRAAADLNPQRPQGATSERGSTQVHPVRTASVAVDYSQELATIN